ncbi:MAG: recombinase family protein [Alphaproteobacteria bacterium]|nr:recombinase family protein [Alphaproteobacteria bacterium]
MTAPTATAAIPRVAIYARCSADKQAEKDLSIPAQLDCCRAGAQQRGWEVVAEYIDAAESATTDDRPQFREMIAAARQKPPPFDYIVVWKFSRFSRNREDSVLYKRMLERNRVRVVSLNEPVDDSPAGRMLEAILESVDEFYSQNLAQDISRGLRKNASMGYRNGGPPPIGYRKKRTGPSEGAPRIILEPDPQWAPLVQRIFRMALAGEGVTAIAATLNAEGVRTPRGKALLKTTIHKLLTNDVYRGVLTWGVKRTGLQKHKPPEPIKVEDAHEGLVTREEFEQVQRMLAERAPDIVSANTLANDYLLGGLIFCARCGGMFIGHNARSGAYRYYACQTKKKLGASACDGKSLPKDETEAAVIDLLRGELLTPAYIKHLVDLVNEEADAAGTAARAEVDAVAAQLAEAKRRLNNLYRAIEDGALDLSILAPRIREVKAQHDELAATHAALALAGTPVVRLADDATITRYVERLQTALATGSVNTQRAILRSWISRIEANGTTLTVTFTLPRDVGGGSSAGSSTNEGQNHGLTEVLPRVVNGGGGGSRTVRSTLSRVGFLRWFVRIHGESRRSPRISVSWDGSR